MGNPGTRYPGWLVAALGLQEPEIPYELATHSIVPTVDVVQGGWGRARWASGLWTSVDNAAAQTYSVSGFGAQDDGRLVLYLDAFHSGGAAAGVITLDLYDPILNNTIVLAQPSVPNGGGVASWQEIGVLRPIYVPPGFSLQTTLPARAVGETYSLRWVAASLPAGANPY